MIYRKLARVEIRRFSQIDRSETIHNIYHVRDGSLVLEKVYWEVPDWSLEEKRKRLTELQDVFDKGAILFGAFDDTDLVGMSVLDPNFVATGNERLNLEGLWVSNKYRGKGIGRTLFQLVEQAALERGAKALYVSATPSENTVRFYRRLGCKLAEPVDRYLFEIEPEDIHLELILANPS